MRKKNNKKKSSPPSSYFSISALIIIGIGITTALALQHTQPTRIHDTRPDRIDAYFHIHHAPLAGHGTTFVDAADACDMDWRLLPAIAMQESSGGKHMQYNNPFGWGSAEIQFTSLDEAIMVVGSHLCGHVSTTAKWYTTTSTYEKLYWYNGTVRQTYPAEVQWIMDQI